MQQIYIREPEENEFLENNHEEFKERARELEKKLFPSVRPNVLKIVIMCLCEFFLIYPNCFFLK